jgi:hypothetical protein
MMEARLGPRPTFACLVHGSRPSKKVHPTNNDAEIIEAY